MSRKRRKSLKKLNTELVDSLENGRSKLYRTNSPISGGEYFFRGGGKAVSLGHGEFSLNSWRGHFALGVEDDNPVVYEVKGELSPRGKLIKIRKVTISLFYDEYQAREKDSNRNVSGEVKYLEYLLEKHKGFF